MTPTGSRHPAVTPGIARIGVIAIVVAICSLLLPWWSVALVCFGCGLLLPAARPWQAGLGALLGWSALLLVAMVEGPVGVLAGRLGFLFHAPGWMLLVLTVVFAGALGWSGAKVGRALRGGK